MFYVNWVGGLGSCTRKSELHVSLIFLDLFHFVSLVECELK